MSGDTAQVFYCTKASLPTSFYGRSNPSCEISQHLLDGLFGAIWCRQYKYEYVFMTSPTGLSRAACEAQSVAANPKTWAWIVGGAEGC